MPKKVACMHNCEKCDSRNFTYIVNKDVIIGFCPDCGYKTITVSEEYVNVYRRSNK